MTCNNSCSHPDHEHGSNCGHTAIRHGDHTDYLHDGHLHHPHGDHYDHHSLDINATNPDDCNPVQVCGEHIHGPNCGHPAIPHGDHTDYLVDGRLHHVHNGHCDDHGPVEIVGA